MKRSILLILVVLLMSACSSSKSDYTYDAKPSDPTLEFISDFDGGSIAPIDYDINIDNPESKQCKDFIRIGYYFPKDSTMFVLASKNESLKTRVPANKLVSINGHFNIGGEGSCYAPIKQFMAEEGKEYLVNYHFKNNFCKLEIIEKSSLQQVQSKVIALHCLR